LLHSQLQTHVDFFDSQQELMSLDFSASAPILNSFQPHAVEYVVAKPIMEYFDDDDPH